MFTNFHRLWPLLRKMQFKKLNFCAGYVCKVLFYDHFCTLWRFLVMRRDTSFFNYIVSLNFPLSHSESPCMFVMLCYVIM
jgi:hypothetical protein